MWQVNAAAVALSIAIVVLALEIFSSRLAGSLRENLRATALLPIAYLGAAALLLTGVVLVEAIRPLRGGPATWAAGVSGLSLGLLPVLFGRSSSVVDPDVIQRRRARHAVANARAAVARSLFDRVAYRRLVDLCGDAPISLDIFLRPPAPAGARIIRAAQSGTVEDINLYWLARLARLSESATMGASVSLTVKVGDRVSNGSSLLVLPPGFPDEADRMAARIVKL